MEATRQLVEFCCKVRSEGIPDKVEKRARICVADAIHAILLALPSRASAILSQYFDQSPQMGSCSMVGHGGVNAEAAALFNATLAAVHEIDDVHMDTGLHPGAVIVPASLAASELAGAPAGRFLAAVTTGYEVAVRLSRAAGYRHYHYFHSSATCGTVGAAAAASVALDLTPGQMHNALGLAVTSASGLWEGIKDQAVMAKQLHLGQAAERGIRSARMAALGWIGAEQAIEGPRGFFAAMARPGEHSPGEDADPDRLEMILTDGLGINWAIQRNIFKRYPFCLCVSEPLEGLRDIVRQASCGIDEIDSVLVETLPFIAWMVGNLDPQNEEEARFSLPYALSLVLAGFDPETVPLPAAWLKEKRIRKWLPRVRILGRDDLALENARVTVTFRDGTIVQAEKPTRSLEEREVLARLKRLLKSHGAPDSDCLVEAITNLSGDRELAELGSLLRGFGRHQ